MSAKLPAIAWVFPEGAYDAKTRQFLGTKLMPHAEKIFNQLAAKLIKKNKAYSGQSFSCDKTAILNGADVWTVYELVLDNGIPTRASACVGPEKQILALVKDTSRFCQQLALEDENMSFFARAPFDL